MPVSGWSERTWLLTASLILIAAAVMKWLAFRTAIYTDMWVVCHAVTEVALALALWVKALKWLAVSVAVVLFSVYTGVSLAAYMKGSGCGCFGDVYIHPLITAAIDALLATGLITIANRAWPTRRVHPLESDSAGLIEALPDS